MTYVATNETSGGGSKYSLIVDRDKLSDLSDKFGEGISNLDDRIMEYAVDLMSFVGAGSAANGMVNAAMNQTMMGSLGNRVWTGPAADSGNEAAQQRVEALVDQKSTYTQYKEDIDQAIVDFDHMMDQNRAALNEMKHPTKARI